MLSFTLVARKAVESVDMDEIPVNVLELQLRVGGTPVFGTLGGKFFLFELVVDVLVIA